MRSLMMLLLAAASVSLFADSAQAQRSRGVSAPRITDRFNRSVRPETRKLSPHGMARELRREVGRNRVEINTPRGQHHVDLAGSSHGGRRGIATPHVHIVERGASKITRPATKSDIRNARRVFRSNKTKGKGK